MNKKETEAWGLTYERYALTQKFKSLTKKYSFKNVAEIPAHGVKAMPSIYSVGLGLSDCSITLINGNKKYEKEWEKINLENQVRFIEESNLYQTDIENNSFDLVWNFAFLPICDDPISLLYEMKRISRRYVAIFSVNNGNIGFPFHRFLHKAKKVPWTHGDINYNSMNEVEKVFKENDIEIIEKGFVDTPIWPDSIGFRDMRLHKMGDDFTNVDWESPYIGMLVENNFPTWIKAIYLWEKIPMPMFIKTLYSHIFYVIGEINE